MDRLERFLTSRNIFLLSLLLTLVFYGVISGFDFVWDDFSLIVHNPSIHQDITLSNFFTSGLWNSSLLANFSNTYYRPIVSLSYALQFKLFGSKAAGFHILSLVIHCFNLFFLWMISLRLGLRNWALIFVLMLFSFHPVQVSAISFISCQGDLLALFFTLISMCFWLRNDSHRYWAILSAAVALLCKETAVLLPVVLVLYDVWVKKNRYSQWKVYAPILLLPIYFILRKVVLGDLALPKGGDHFGFDSPGSFRTLKFIGRLFFPDPTAPEDNNIHPALWQSVSCHASLLTLFVLSWYKIFKDGKSRWLLVSFLLFLMPIADWPGTNLRFSDQLLYVSSASFVMLMGFVLDRFPWRIKTLGILLLVPLLVLSNQQRAVWRNSATLWSYALSFDPNNISYNINYGSGLYEMGMEKESCDQSYKTLVMTLQHPNPTDQQILVYNLGKCFEKDHPNVAEKYYKAGVDISRGQHWASLHNLGFLLLERGDIEGAEISARRLTVEHPHIFYSWKLMGQVQYKKGLKKESLISYRKAFQLNPADPDLPGLIQQSEK